MQTKADKGWTGVKTTHFSDVLYGWSLTNINRNYLFGFQENVIAKGKI